MKNPHAQALGALGGKARASKLTPEQRKEIAKKGGLARQAKSRHTIPPETIPPHSTT
jgi:hypothetical protein